MIISQSIKYEIVDKGMWFIKFFDLLRGLRCHLPTLSFPHVHIQKIKTNILQYPISNAKAIHSIDIEDINNNIYQYI